MTEKDFKIIKAGETRVRIAPSPTGPMHIGLTRTALFNYLFAKQKKGIFILRIEDTDIKRSQDQWEKDIIRSLKWLGIEPDEGPYRQSDRIKIYSQYLQQLLDNDKAYYCFCSEEELEAEKQYNMSIGQPPIYSGKCRSLSSEQVERLKKERSSIIRFKSPAKKVKFQDLIRGNIEFDSSLLGDFSIAKSLEMPLYNFAVVVDDFEMKISHVIRGEDHISNTPKQILLQEALNFPSPQYAHLALIMGTDKSKLSKRHGAVSVTEYRKQGYLPEAVLNYIALLGWNPGTEKEIFSLASLIKEFSLEKCQKGGAIFNFQRLDWINGFYIRHRSIEKLTELCIPYLIESKLIKPKQDHYEVVETKEKIGSEYIQKAISLYQERLKRLGEISEFTDYLFKDELYYEKELLQWKQSKDTKDYLKILVRILSEAGDWTKENLENILIKEAEKIGDRGELLWPLRVALTGKKSSAGPFEIAEVLGKDKTLKRIKKAIEIYG